MTDVDPSLQAEWDGRYREREQLWSGNPNGALVAETPELAPGRALDVGCGEGADAVWLARQGWAVTAVEVSRVALDRAEQHGSDAGVDVDWRHASITDVESRSYDLVSAMYAALLRTPGQDAERAMLDAVKPGGVLLFVHHAGMEDRELHEGAPDPKDYVWPRMVTALFDDDWEVLVDEQRPRQIPESGAGAHHVDDVVLKARRLR